MALVSSKALIFSVVLAACVPASQPQEVTAPDVAGLRFATTFGDADGNRYVEGTGSIAADDYVDVQIVGTPMWAVGIASGDDVVVVVADTEGVLTGFTVEPGGVVPRELNQTTSGAGTPPGLVAGEGVLVLLPPGETGSNQSNAVALQTGGLAFLGSDGALIITDGDGNRRIELDALLDGRIVISNDGRLAVLTKPTDQYDHAVLADRFEASGFSFVSLANREIVAEGSAGGDVFEGMVGMFADLDDDGIEEFVVTVSNEETGSRIVAYGDDAKTVAQSDAIGRGGRWRHQIAAAPFGPDGEIELVDVRTPHIGGIVEYMRMEDGALVVAATLPGYSSHNIRSRNLDMAVAFDVQGDGQTDLVVPTQSKDELAVLRRTVDGVEVVMSLPLGGMLAANLVAVEASDGSIVLVASRADGTVRIWR